MYNARERVSLADNAILDGYKINSSVAATNGNGKIYQRPKLSPVVKLKSSCSTKLPAAQTADSVKLKISFTILMKSLIGSSKPICGSF